MGKIKIGLIVFTSLALVGLVAAFVSQAASESARKIVVFSEEVFVNEAARGGLLKEVGIHESIKILPLINGVAVLMPSKAAEKALAESEGILRIDNDDLVFALGKPFCNSNNICEPELGENPSCSDCKNGEEEPTPPPEPPAETLPWGVDRIDADLVWGFNTGQGVRVAILDTGIDVDHPDLLVAGGANVLGPFRTSKYNDDNGHGTHVAGIVAARDNEIGVIGVAPDAQLYAVKAFNRKGIGFVSDIVDGINWSMENQMQVINMSFGETGDNASLRTAIQKAYAAGIVMVAAAGNDGDDFIYYPARYPETIAVSATTDKDELATFSSYATDLAQVEAVNLLAAPGQDINSTWNNGGYHVGSGTSMATPHVVGTAALIIARGVSGPENVMTTFKSTVEDLGTAGNDIYFGFGLVDAENAVK